MTDKCGEAEVVGAQRIPPIEEQLRAFPVPPRHVLIEAAGEIESLRRKNELLVATVEAMRARHVEIVDHIRLITGWVSDCRASISPFEILVKLEHWLECQASKRGTL